MLHTLTQILVASPPIDPGVQAPPNSASFLKIAGMVMWGAAVAIVVGVGVAFAVMAGSGHSESQTAGKKGSGVVWSLVAAAGFAAAGTLAVWVGQ